MTERMVAPKDWQPGWVRDWMVGPVTVKSVSPPLGGWVMVMWSDFEYPGVFKADDPLPIVEPDELVYRITHGTGYTFWSSEPPSADAINFGDPRSKCEVGRVEWLGPYYAGDETR